MYQGMEFSTYMSFNIQRVRDNPPRIIQSHSLVLQVCIKPDATSATRQVVISIYTELLSLRYNSKNIERPLLLWIYL